MEVKEIQGEMLTTAVREQSVRGISAKPSAPPKETGAEKNSGAGSRVDEEAIGELADRINEFMRSMNYSLQFVPDRESGMVVIKVLDSKGKVLRQIPPAEMASIASMLDSKIGMILNERWG